MALKNKKILIEGIGGIGGLVAARLLAVGHDCTLITGNKEITSQILSAGVIEHIEGDKQKIVYPQQVYTTLSELDESLKFDFALLAMKADSVVEAAKSTIFHLFSHGFVVTLQNGIVKDLIIKEIDEGRIISGVMAFGSTMIESGQYKQTTPGSIFIGELHGKITPRLTQLGEILENVLPVNLSENIEGVLWNKLAINATFNSLGAISGQTWGEMLNSKQKRSIGLKIYAEVIDTANAANIKLARITGNPYLLYLPKNSGFFKRKLKDFFLRLATYKYKNTKPSTVQSLLRGKKTEIEYLNGYIVEKGKELGIDTVYNEYLVKMVKEIEEGKREMDPKNIDEIIQKLDL